MIIWDLIYFNLNYVVVVQILMGKLFLLKWNKITKKNNYQIIKSNYY